MATRKRYRKKGNASVTAVQLKLDTQGFNYRKWGAEQHCKQGDWLVDNQGDCYTVDSESFAKSYRLASPGVYHKHATVWAEVSSVEGEVKTREGSSHYLAGDYLVANDAGGADVYAVSKEKFESMYEELSG